MSTERARRPHTRGGCLLWHTPCGYNEHDLNSPKAVFRELADTSTPGIAMKFAYGLLAAAAILFPLTRPTGARPAAAPPIPSAPLRNRAFAPSVLIPLLLAAEPPATAVPTPWKELAT